MSSFSDISWREQTSYVLRAPRFTPGFLMGYVLLILLCFLFALVVSVLCLIWPVSLLYSFMIAFGFLCTVASVSALFIHDCLWFSLYCGQCLYFVHSWLIAFGFLQRVCQWDDVCFVLDQHTWYDFYSACSLKPVEG